MHNKSQKPISKAPGAKDVIDLEDYTKLNKKPPKGKLYKVKIQDDKYTFDKDCVLGRELLEKSGNTPVECFSLYQKFKGCDFEKIGLDEKVDLSKPGIEKFTVKSPEVFHYTVDGEPEITDQDRLTPNQILELAGVTPVSDYYLVQVLTDQSQISYKDKLDNLIQMECPGLKFISVYQSTTEVA